MNYFRSKGVFSRSNLFRGNSIERLCIVGSGGRPEHDDEPKVESSSKENLEPVSA